jgi:hypothetical protein
MSKVSRREFLRVVAVTASAAALWACTSTPKITPMATVEPALSEVELVVLEVVLVEKGKLSNLSFLAMFAAEVFDG